MFNITWEVATSDGKNYYEGKSPFEFRDGDKLPFARMQERMAELGVDITFCALRAPDGRTWNLHAHKPIKKDGKYIGERYNPKFRVWDLSEPLDYNVFRKIGNDQRVGRSDGGDVEVRPAGQEIFTVGEAIYPSGVLQVWVSEANPRHSWNIFIPNEPTDGSSIRSTD